MADELEKPNVTNEAPCCFANPIALKALAALKKLRADWEQKYPDHSPSTIVDPEDSVGIFTQFRWLDIVIEALAPAEGCPGPFWKDGRPESDGTRGPSFCRIPDWPIAEVGVDQYRMHLEGKQYPDVDYQLDISDASTAKEITN